MTDQTFVSISEALAQLSLAAEAQGREDIADACDQLAEDMIDLLAGDQQVAAD